MKQSTFLNKLRGMLFYVEPEDHCYICRELGDRFIGAYMLDYEPEGDGFAHLYVNTIDYNGKQQERYFWSYTKAYNYIKRFINLPNPSTL